MADLNILDILAALGPVAGGAAGANQKQNNFEDVTRQAGWNNLETNRLARDKFAAVAPEQRLRTSNLANMTKNFTPTSIAWGGKGSGKRGEMPVYSGGASHVGKDPRVQATADSVLGQELESQLAGAKGADAKMSPQPAIGETSALDKLLGGLGLGGSALAALKAGGSPSGGSFDLGKILDMFKHHGDGGFTGPIDQPDWQGPTDDALWQGPTDDAGAETSGHASAGDTPLPGVDDGEGYFDDDGNYIQGQPNYFGGGVNPEESVWGDE